MGGRHSRDSRTKNMALALKNFDHSLEDNIRESKYPLKPHTNKKLCIRVNKDLEIEIKITEPMLTVEWLNERFLT